MSGAGAGGGGGGGGRGERAQGRAAAVVLAAGIVAGGVSGGPGAARAELPGKPRADWARGLVLATAVGIADRHAPSPVAARGPARRAAEEAARKQLAAAVPALPLAAGGTLAAAAREPAVAARIARAVAGALVVEAEPSTDGSWRVTLGLPIEALRQAVAGPRAAPASDAEAPAVVVVEGVRAAPAIGYTVGGVAGATLWVREVPAWARGAPRIRARGAAGGAITVAGGKGAESTLFVIVAP